MPVHRTAKSRQAALQRVARPGHVRNAPSAPFMKTVIANLDNDWKLTSEDIDAFVRGNPQAE